MELFSGACWVWLNSCIDKNVYINFFDTFDLDGDYPDVIFNISADTQYVLYINDSFVDCGQYSDYPEYKVYDSLDITKYVTCGKNTIKVCAYYQGEDSATYRLSEPGVIYSIVQNDKVTLISGNSTLACINDAYKNSEVPKISPQLSFSFSYDINKEEFFNKDTDLSKFCAADIKENNLKLYKRPVKKLDILKEREGIILSQGIFKDSNKECEPAVIMQNAFLSNRNLYSMTNKIQPITLPCEEGITFHKTDGDGVYLVIDLLSEDTGFITLDIELNKCSDIFIGYGEHLDDLRVRTSIVGRNFCATYKGKQGRQQYTYYFKRSGLRYLQLHSYADDITIYYAGIKPVHYPVSDKPFFKCSDNLHNKIYEVSVKTLHLCMHEHYEDCPWREQSLYSMDSRNQMLCGYYSFGEFEFARASIKLMALSLRKDNLLELCSPARIPITIPSFSAIFVTQVYEYLLYSRDTEFVKEMIPVVKAITDGFLSRMSTLNGLVPCYHETPYWNFYEWQEGLDGGDIFRDYELAITYDLPLNAFVSMATGSLSEIYRLLGEEKNSMTYSDIKNKLNNNIIQYFWSNENQAYASFLNDDRLNHYSELSNSLAVYCGACNDECLDTVLLKLSSRSLIPITLSHTIFKYEALMKRKNTYSAYVFENISEVWGKMLFSGATTFWETEKGAWDFSNSGSLCHGWSAVPVYFYFAYGLGIKPDINGSENYIINPSQSGLYNINGKLLTPEKKEINI
jgi:alpha-L-rhamnosidase